MAKTGKVAEAPAPVAKAAPAKKVVKEEPVEPVYVTSTQLAAQIGIKPTILRRWLRTLPEFQDGGYTRYKWEPEDPFLESAPEAYAKYASQDEERRAKREAENAAKAAKKKAAENGKTTTPKKKAKAEPEPEPEEDEAEEEFEDDEEAEEIE